MPFKGFECTQCGHCCMAMGGGLDTIREDSEDYKRLETDERVIPYLENGYIYGTRDFADSFGVGIVDLWVGLVSGEDCHRCPFVRKKPNKNEYNCTIRDVRPDVCRDYPKDLEHARSTGCRGLFNGKLIQSDL